MIKLLLFLIPFHAHAFSLNSLSHGPHHHFNALSAVEEMEKEGEKPKIRNFSHLSQSIISDRKKRVNPEFYPSDYFLHRTKFWFGVYSLYDSDSTVIHDKRDFQIIYGVISFRHLLGVVSNVYRYEAFKSWFNRNITYQLKYLINGELKPNIEMKPFDHSLKLYRKKKDNFNPTNHLSYIRTQTGQKDRLHDGLKNSLEYLPTIKDFFEVFDLPEEIIALPFLESTFNLNAVSKVGASGVWQLMPSVARQYLGRHRKLINTKNPLLSSLASLHLIKENNKVLNGAWDLTITSYNSGAYHLRKATRKLGLVNPKLEDIFQNYQTGHLGFASRNFYPSFLALVFTYKYMDILFPETFEEFQKKFKLSDHHSKVYLSKCSFTPSKLFQNGKADLSKNLHFRYPRKKHNRGNIIFSAKELNPKRFYQLKDREILRSYPRKFSRWIKRKRCT